MGAAETAKAKPRRLSEDWFDEFIHDPGIDIGCQHDPVSESFRKWDVIFGDGDAQKMEGVEDESFQTVYASHILEHLPDPIEAVYNWFRILKPGGFLIIIVPHRDLYEQRIRLPSQWNVEHKTFWLPFYPEKPDTRGLKATVTLALPDEEWAFRYLRVCDEGYISRNGGHPGGEYSIEAVIKKGRFPYRPALEKVP